MTAAIELRFDQLLDRCARLLAAGEIDAASQSWAPILVLHLGACGWNLLATGRRWQRDSAWLHVEERNSAGLGLYQVR